VTRLGRRLRPERSWIVSQDPYLIGMLLTAPGYRRGARRNPRQAIWDNVREFVTRDRLGYGPTRMAEMFPADWDAFYESGPSPDQAVRLVVWNTTLENLLAKHGAGRNQFHFDFERTFLYGYTPSEAVQEALGLAIHTPSDLKRADGGALRDGVAVGDGR
jgi:hypothetical protein